MKIREMFYAVIQLPPGSSLERTNQVAQKLQGIAEKMEEVKSVSSLAGYEILTEGTGANTGTCLINLKTWENRDHSVGEVMEELEKKCQISRVPQLNFSSPLPFRVMELRRL